MLCLFKRNRLFFTGVSLVALLLRVLFAVKFHRLDGDSLIYGDIAKNWLVHGVFGVSTAAGPLPTYIRLPGYPAFLAAVWGVIGLEHYHAILVLQVLVDVGTCFLVADLARRVISERAAKTAFALTAVCPFLMTYVAAPLSETLAIFFAALSLDSAVAGLDGLAANRYRAWVVCGVALAAGILLRPDGGILLAAILGYLAWLFFKGNMQRQKILIAGLVVVTLALAPLVPWTARNWRDFHRFQPLAPRYANAPDEPVYYGFQRWTRTWMLDFVSVSEVYWNFPDQSIDTSVLPNRAFDSSDERQRTGDVFGAYNDQGKWSPELDSELAQIARERIARAPLRYYLWLPAGRIADMWLRPRTELLGINDRWWEFSDDPGGAFWATSLGLINLAYVGLALLGIWRYRHSPYTGLLVLFVLLRSVFLGTLENPEPRYTLECYPVVLLFAAAALGSRAARQLGGPSPQRSQENTHRAGSCTNRKPPFSGGPALTIFDL